ncbi:ribonuclease R [Nitrosomonas marina]|uniref:Ribonuclease R n=1 Tax=Nitrosomonas marina TaxID=917 RepID=A0A1H8BS45_9PROT|nr:ribonuclease R [Nitrosomonas marina]SEM84954.1 RNAse R [Nitrosomonas marina]
MSIKEHRKLRKQDPYLDREKTRYTHPLPSREFILQILKQNGIPTAENQLQKLLGIKRHEQDAFTRRLAAMLREGQIFRNRKGDLCVMEKLDLIKGTVQGHADGYGFLIPDDGSADLFLSAKEMHKILHGDHVLVRQTGLDKRGRREAVVVEVLERVNHRLVGRLYMDHGIMHVVAENKRISQDILIPGDSSLNASAGQVVMVEIIQQPSKQAQPIGRIVEILGDYIDAGMEIEIALRKHDLPHVFSDEIEKLSTKLPARVLRKDYAERRDLRHLPLVTIDGETARDFDDAVYCERDDHGFTLYVAIADVSQYVHPDDAFDREALTRGNSVYFPQRVIPMLPEVLSNGLCSLNPKKNRLCMVCEIRFDAHGEQQHYVFYPALMKSHARLTYTRVAAMLTHPKSKEAKQHAKLLPDLKNLHALFKVLLKARKKRGAIDFETTETQMLFNAQGKIDKIEPIQRNDAHRLIEECMLAANVCAADFLQQHGHPVLYRIHERPAADKLEALRDFLKEFGVQLGGKNKPKASDYAKTLSKIKNRPDIHLLQTVMLRSLPQAQYSPDNCGHFGLAYDAYTHFTSPIRRYPDLLTHRAIKAVLRGEQYTPGDWQELGSYCSQTERRADEATRDVETWLKCFFMQDRIGECFDGIISSVTGFGLFVALEEMYVEGLIHISELPSDYFHFDPARHCLLGERTGRQFRIGDRLSVKLVRVNLETSKIDFILNEFKKNTVPRKNKSKHKTR